VRAGESLEFSENFDCNLASGGESGGAVRDSEPPLRKEGVLML